MKLLRKKLKKLIRRFEHTKIFSEKNNKFREFNFEKVRKNKFFYKKFFNVKNDDNVQNTMDRNHYRNKSRNRKYRENRRRENEISRDKRNKSENFNFIDFLKTYCFKCR